MLPSFLLSVPHPSECVVLREFFSSLPLQSGTKRRMGQEECANCGRRVYLAERLQVENCVFHRSCFRCMVCNISLRPGAHRFDGGRFYCASHYTTMKRSRNIKKVIEERGISEDVLYTAMKKPKAGSPLPLLSEQQQEPAPALPLKKKHQSPPPQQSEDYVDPLPAYAAVVKEKSSEEGKSRPSKLALSKALLDAAAAKAVKSGEEASGKPAAVQSKHPKDTAHPVTLEDLPEGHYEIDPQYMDSRRQRKSQHFHDEPTAAMKSGEEKEPTLSALSKVLMTDRSAVKKGKNGKEALGNAAPALAMDTKDVVGRQVTLEDLPEGHYETDPQYMDTRRQKKSSPQLDENLYVIPQQDGRGDGGEDIPPALPANPPPVKSQLVVTSKVSKPAENGSRREPCRPDNLTHSIAQRAVETAEDAKKRRPPPPRPAPFRRPPPVPPGVVNAPPPIRKPPRRKKKKITIEQIDDVLQQISDRQQQLEERGVALEQEIRKSYDSKLMLCVKD